MIMEQWARKRVALAGLNYVSHYGCVMPGCKLGATAWSDILFIEFLGYGPDTSRCATGFSVTKYAHTPCMHVSTKLLITAFPSNPR